MVQIATQFGVAVQQAQLLQKTQEQALDLKLTLNQLKRTQAQLVHSEKMSSLGQMVAGVAHEINNPLNFISGGLNIIKDLHNSLDWEGREKDREKCVTATNMAFDGLERSVSIVKAMMTFSHRGGSKKTETDLNEIIDNTLMFLSSKISEHHRQRHFCCKQCCFRAKAYYHIHRSLGRQSDPCHFQQRTFYFRGSYGSAF